MAAAVSTQGMRDPNLVLHVPMHEIAGGAAIMVAAAGPHVGVLVPFHVADAPVRHMGDTICLDRKGASKPTVSRR